jgi:hypothetical protein
MTNDDLKLSEVIAQHQESIDRLRLELERTSTLLQENEMELEMLQRVYNRFKVEQRKNQDPLPGTTEPAGDTPREFSAEASRFLSMDRSSAAEQILRTAARPMAPVEVSKRLNALGRDDAYEAVNAALAYLKRSGRAHTPRRGQWVIGPKPEIESSESEDTPEVVPVPDRDADT